MKNLILILCASALILSACKTGPKEFTNLGQVINSPLFGYQFKLKGKVKELTVKNYWAETTDGKVVNGRPVTMEERKTNPVTRDYTETYNENGLLQGIVGYGDNGKKVLELKTTITGNRIEKYDYFMADTLSFYSKVLYDGERITGFERYNPGNDTVQVKVNVYYEANGFISKYERKNKAGAIISTITLERDADGRVLKNTLYGMVEKDTSVYTYTYDKNGFWLTGHEVYRNPPVTLNTTYTFEFDKMGNWTRMVINNDGKPYLIKVRDIKYY